MQPDPGSDPNPRREFIRAAAATVTGGLALAAGHHRAYGQSAIETLHILCIAAAGSAPDIVARRVAEQLSGRHARTAVVDNRPGAAGRIAVNALKMAPADGSTLLLGGLGVSGLNPMLYTTLGYDPLFDVSPVSLAAEMPLALAVGPAVPDSVGNLRELVDWMRRNPALANAGSPGIGSVPHLLQALFLHQAGVAWQHVAYSSGPPAVVALMGGQIAALVLPEPVLNPQRASGRLRVLATSGAQRSRLMPDVPTFVEQGWRDVVALEWFAFYMSGRVPEATIAAASSAIGLAIARPELVATFAAQGISAVSSTPAELATRIAAEKRMWEPVIRVAGIRAQ